MTPSLGARKLIMCAYLYYRRHSPLISDGEYDQLSEGIAARWHKLDPFIQWQLGSRLEVVSTGGHIKITRVAEQGALSWYTSVKGIPPHGHDIHKDEWVWDDKHEVGWVTAEA